MAVFNSIRVAGSLVVLLCFVSVAKGHVEHGRLLPVKAGKLQNPLEASSQNLRAGQIAFEKSCSGCHGKDGKANTPVALKLAVRPTNLTDRLMDTMRDGELWWVETHGVSPVMPAFAKALSSDQRWQIVLWVKDLQRQQRAAERAKMGSDFDWDLPAGFPFPNVPADNPVTAAKVTLGRYLFYDKRLSANQTQSCATCHQQRYAFADARGRGIGSTGEVHPRGAMSLANVAYSPVLTWANPGMRKLEQQALVPIFGDHPVEMGMEGKEDVLIRRLRDERYEQLFNEAFPSDQDPFTLANIVKAIASFERTIISGRSPYDQYRTGQNSKAISPSAKRGEALFYSERAECFHCHGGFNFTGTTDYLDKGFAEVEFHNNGLYNIKGPISYPSDNPGIYEFTQDPADVGRFKAPSLRNIAVTAPYMHDGSIQTLAEVIDHYSAGGRTIKSGPYAGVGADNPNRSEFVKPIGFSGKEKNDLLAFLNSLTDQELLVDERFSDPWLKESDKPKHILRGVVRDIDLKAATLLIKHGPVDTFMPAMTMEYHLVDPSDSKRISVGETVQGYVSRRGDQYWLDQVRPIAKE
jgi:cytochrome c peroxidase